MSLPESVRLTMGLASYLEARGIPATILHVEALREMILLQLARLPAGSRPRRSALITFRQNERLYEQLTGRPCDEPNVKAALDELEALLASERSRRRKVIP